MRRPLASPVDDRACDDVPSMAGPEQADAGREALAQQGFRDCSVHRPKLRHYILAGSVPPVIFLMGVTFRDR